MVNAIKNQGFETGTTVPDNWTVVPGADGNVPILDATVFRTGTRSVRFDIPGTLNKNSGSIISDIIPVIPNREYIYRAWSKALNIGANGARISVIELDVSGKYLVTHTMGFVAGTYDWSERTNSFITLPDAAYLYADVSIRDGYGTCWVDDLRMDLLYDIVKNGSLELGTPVPTNWKFTTNNGITPTIDNTVSHTGTKSVKINVPGTTTLLSGILASDIMTSSPGKEFFAVAWGKTQGATGSHRIRFVEADSMTTWLRQTTLTFDLGTNDWTEKYARFVTGANTATMYIVASVDGTGTFWVDDIQLLTPDDNDLPIINITEPIDGLSTTTAAIKISGTSSDASGIDKVEVRVGTGTPQVATGKNNWDTTVTLLPGNNVIFVRATDFFGNVSEKAVNVTLCSTPTCNFSYNPVVV